MASANPPPAPSPKYGRNASLFVRNLHPSVTESQLFNLFSPNVVSTLVCRDRVTGASLCYGFVDFADPHQASKAMELLNFTQVNGKPIKIMFSHRVPGARRSEHAKMFVNNLDTSIDDDRLHDIFAAFGTVLHCHVATDSNGQSKGYGFIHFEHDASAQDALKSLNGIQINDRQLYVRLSVHSKERNQTKVSHKLTNLYVKNFSVTTTDEDLKKVFSNFGIISSAVIVRDANGNSRGFGFVSFQNPDAAAVAVEKVNRTTPIDDNVWYVAKAVRHGESEFWQRSISEPEKNKNIENLLVGDFHCKNFEQSSRDESLKGLYSDFGNAASCKVKQDSQGQRRSSAFVTFSSSAEVNRAARSEIRAPVIVGPHPSVMPGYHTLEPSFAPQLPSFGQAAYGFPWQPAHTLQQQQLPAIWSGFTSNFVVPLRAPKARPEIREPVIVGPRYHTLGPNFAPQLPSFVQAAYGFPRQPAHTLQQQQLPAIWSGVISNFVAPLRASPQLVHHSANQGDIYMASGWNVASPALVPQASMCPMAPTSFNVTGMPMPLMDIQQLGPVPFSTSPPALVPNNSNQGFMYMHNVWNVVSPPLVPPDLISPVVAMPHGVSRMHVPPIYVPRPVPFSMLPFASPELQRLMSGQGPFPVFECMEHGHVGELKGSPRVVFFSGKTISIVFAEQRRRNSEKNRTVVLNHQCFTTCRHIIHQLSPCKQIHFRSGFNAKQSVLCLSSSSRETDSSRSTCPQDLPLIAKPSKEGKIEVCKQGMSKTELCNKWEKTGTCPYGKQCLFAHGVHELRPVVRHSLYKTQICRMISAGGTCHYSHRCHFRHSLDPIVEGEVVL